MEKKHSKTHKIIFLLTILFLLAFVFYQTIGKYNNLEFKNENLRIILSRLLLLLPVLLIVSSVILWRLVEDTYNTRLTISASLVVVATLIFVKTLGDAVFLQWRPWKTEKEILVTEKNKVYHLLYQKRTNNFIFRVKEERIVKAESLLWLFWKIAKVENINALK